MKISIEIRKPDTEGKRAIRLIYYGGSYTDPETGKRRHKRSREPLDLFMYDCSGLLITAAPLIYSVPEYSPQNTSAVVQCQRFRSTSDWLQKPDHSARCLVGRKPLQATCE